MSTATKRYPPWPAPEQKIMLAVAGGWVSSLIFTRAQPILMSAKVFIVSIGFHVPDPIYFESGIKVTIQQIGFFLDDSDVLLKSGTPVYRAPAAEQNALQLRCESAKRGMVALADGP